jgi:hypothetical protein
MRPRDSHEPHRELRDALHESHDLAPLIGVAALTLVVTAALWWISFWPPHHTAIRGLSSSLLYGYGHYVIFAAAAAFSAGIEVEIDVIKGDSALAPPGASFAYTVPIAIFVLGIWVLAIRRHGDRIVNTAVPLGAVLVLVDPVTPVPIALTALILIAMVAVLVWRRPVDVEASALPPTAP